MLRLKLYMATLVMAAGILAADKPQTDAAWHILVQAVDVGGPDAASALGMLGAIGNPQSRALIEATLKGKDVAAIGLVAVGLTPDQCALYLPDLARAARDPGGGPKLSILDAIARAGSRKRGQPELSSSSESAACRSALC